MLTIFDLAEGSHPLASYALDFALAALAQRTDGPRELDLHDLGKVGGSCRDAVERHFRRRALGAGPL